MLATLLITTINPVYSNQNNLKIVSQNDVSKGSVNESNDNSLFKDIAIETLSGKQLELIKKTIKPSQYRIDQQKLFTVDSIYLLCIANNDSNVSIFKKRCRPIKTENMAVVLSSPSLLIRSLIYSPSLKSKIDDIDQRRWLVRKAFATWYPNLSLSSGSVLKTFVSNTQNYGSPSDSSNPSVSGTAFQPSDPISTSSGGSSSVGLVDPYTTTSSYTQAYPVVTLNWTIFDPSRADTINAAKHSYESARQDSLYSAHQIASRTTKLLTSLVKLEYEIASYLDQFKSYQKILSVYKSQFESGYLPSTEILTLSSQANEILHKLNSAILNYENNSSELKLIVRIKQSNTLILPPEIQLPSKWPLSISETEKIIDNYPKVKSSSSIASKYKSLAKASLKEYVPKLSVLGYMTFVGTQGSMSYSPPTQPSGAWSQQLSSYIGMNATWNIFDGFSSFQEAKSYESQSNSYNQRSVALKQQLVETAVSAINTLNYQRMLIEPLVRSYTDAIRALKSQRKRFAIGYVDPTIVYRAEIEAAQIVSNFADTYGLILDSYYTLNDITGTQIEDVTE